MSKRALMLALGLTACLSVPAMAQTVIYETYSPVVTAEYAAPAPVAYRYGYRGIAGSTFTNYYPSYNPAPAVTAYSPVVTAAPVVAASPVVTSYSPVVTAYSPVVAETPVVTYSPVVTEAYSPVVTTTYSPVVTAAYAPAPVVTSYYAPVRSKVLYVPGQPIRNFFRGITP